MAFPTLAVTPGTGQTINTLPNAGQTTAAGSLSVVLASDQAAVPITGTFWQTTQPVSGTVSISGAVGVTGTFWQATQPVSLAAFPALVAGTAIIGKVGIDQTTPGTTNKVSINTNGQATMANSTPVALASDHSTITVGGVSAVVSGTITRPADTTAYASGDLIANSTTAGSVVPVALAVARVNAGTGCIRRARLTTSKTGLAGTEAFRVHLFKTSPTVANGDNGAFSVNGVTAIHIGHFDVILDRVFSDGAKGTAIPAVGSEIVFDAGAGTTNIYALLEARGAYTPASAEVFTIALEVLRD